MKSDPHPFYCHVKKCRKTLVETPEYLSEDDWALAGELVAAGEAGDIDRWARLVRSGAEAFFYRMVGWPEGRRYLLDGSPEYWAMWFGAFVDRSVPEWRSALAGRLGPLFVAAGAPA